MHHFYHQIIIKTHLLYQNMIQRNKQFVFIKTLFWIFYERNKIVLNVRYHCYFLFSTNRNYYHINSSNKKFILMLKQEQIIVNLCSKKGKNNNNSTCQLRLIQNVLLTSIVDTPEKDLPNVDRKSDMRKVRTSSIKSCSKHFLIRAMWNRVNRGQNNVL